MQTAPESPRPLARTDKIGTPSRSVPLSKQSCRKSSYLRRDRTPSGEPSTSLRNNPSGRRNGPGGTRTLTCDLDGVLCCHYTTGPRQSICDGSRECTFSPDVS